MNKLLSIDPDVIKRLQNLTKNERIDCLLSLIELTEAFGQPHKHSGLGIRKLGEKLFECRANLSLRFLFQVRQTDLYISFLGNHNEIKTLLRSGKY
ncbi:hypothetical protein L0156_17985 [bacterium]|nr:hypothetical protein [bacterium]